MPNNLSSFELAIWIALIAGKLVLCLCIFSRRVLRRLPWFSTYILVSTAKSLLLASCSYWADYSLYYKMFYWASHMVSLFAFLTLIEFARQVLPGFDLPRRSDAIAWSLWALAVMAIFGITWPLRYQENRAEVAIYFLVAIAFIVIAGYAWRLGLRWSRFLGGVSCTLGALYLADGIAKALMAHFSYPSPLWLLVRQTSMMASLFAVISWTIFVLIPWGEYKMTEEDLAKFEAIVNAAEESVRRFVASGGE